MATEFTSQSENFISALTGEIDPRTGAYGCRFTLAQLAGNAGLGPEIPVILNYSPLSTGNSGFGIGVTMPLSSYNKSTRTLQLSSGEQYKVTENSNKLYILHATPINFRVEKRNDGYYIFYKNGTTEILTAPGKAGDMKVVETILSPAGHKMALAWENFGSSKRLISVRDESSVLLKVSRNSNNSQITFHIFPDSKEAHSVTLSLKNNYLTSVTNASVSPAQNWKLEYTSGRLTAMTGPTGLVEQVTYSQNGHRFPAGGPATKQPYVISYRQIGGDGALISNLRYQFSDKNFLGYGGSNRLGWNKNTDFLYGVLGDYEYSSTETALDENNTVLSTTVRTYNNLHLQTKELSRRNGTTCSYSAETEYHAVKGKAFDAQPPQFQMPRRQTATWTDTSLPVGEQFRSEVTLTEFDEHGNPVRQENPDGSVTEYEFYPAAGDGANCPPEPNGFVRFIKRTTVTPPQTDYADTPIQVTEFRYATLGKTDCIVQSSRADFSDGVLLSRQSVSYNTDSTSSEFGRITAITDDKYHQGRCFTSQQRFDSVVRDGMLEQRVTVTGHDGITGTYYRTQSALSGLLLSETNMQGVKNTFTYDRLGRPLTATCAVGSAYEKSKSWEYSVEKGVAITTEKDASGNQVKKCFDSAGRSIGNQFFDTDTTRQWFEINSCRYNALGESQYSSGKDWLTTQSTGSQYYQVDGEATYDGWGVQTLQSFSDGLRTHRSEDPISLVQQQYAQGDKDGVLLSSGKSVTVLDSKSKLPVQEGLYDASGTEQGMRKHRYDGRGLLRESTDELGNTTRYTWDAWGRELTRILPDNTLIEREYAPHLSGKEVTCIRVTGKNAAGKKQTWELGTREYDSVGRITQETVGGRVTTYRYDGVMTQPASVTLPSGKTLTYRYLPELGQVVSSVTADGITQSFDYDAKTGRLLQAKEGDVVNHNRWSPSGMLLEEQFIQDKDARQAGYGWSLAGEPVSYTDITGASSQYERNEHGQVVRVNDRDMTVVLSYDALQRLQKMESTDNVSGAKLTTMLVYDDLDREVKRTLVDSAGTTLIVTQSWLKNGLLSGRITQQNDLILKEEQYQYDCRNRLIGYYAFGSVLPTDAYGYAMTAQTYRYDALNNLTQVVTTLADGSSDTATFLYNNINDPTQLSGVTHTHAGYPAAIQLEYDAEGRMTKDEAGRTLRYDALGRLSGVATQDAGACTYRYDAQNRLVSQQG
ncbi:YD repeat-containing protein [Pantoea alhagi]|uniref:RHS repeat protein n=1 Tax=Mixta sp. BE291 TaxID=3158787 RepID=UPI002865CDA1|nr:YD repeat-containing protein [Pantoea alhagi]